MSQPPPSQPPAACRYQPGDAIEYTSFGPPDGWSAGTVIRYAPAARQWQPCPACREQAIPPAAGGGGLQHCPRCQAEVRFPAVTDLLVDIRTHGGSIITVRESQLRRPEGDEAAHG